MSKSIAKVWTFGSSSSPDKTYETILYTDRSTSCDCPGWTRRVDARGLRTCKHTRYVDQDLADTYAIRSKDYRTGTAPVTIAPTKGRKILLGSEDV